MRERFGRPAFAVAVAPSGLGVGSGRSIHGVDLGRAVRAAESGLLVKGGGHAMAAGITIAMDRLAEFEGFLTDTLRRQVADAAETERALIIDSALSADGATLETIAELDRAGPFGAGHPEPVLAFPAHRIAYAEVVSGNHVRASIAAAGGTMLKAMAFRAAETPLGRRLLSREAGPVHVAGTISADHWQGRSRPALRILDVADAV